MNRKKKPTTIDLSYCRQGITDQQKMYEVAFQLRAAADSANNKVEDVIRAAAHPQINKRLVDAMQS